LALVGFVVPGRCPLQEVDPLGEREPDSRPPPVSFSPPKAPPISAPEVPMLTLAMPQSEPAADRKISASC
jgi:hypothetical protein